VGILAGRRSVGTAATPLDCPPLEPEKQPANMILTYRYRVKDASNGTRNALRAQARAVNFVWNYCCQIDHEAHARWKAGRVVKRPSAFDLANLCRGTTKELGIHSDTIDAICRKFAAARNACFPKTPRFRSFKRNLDFVPFSNFKRPAKLEGDRLTVLGRTYRLWLSRPVPSDANPKTFEFSTDARGRWYVNIQIELLVAEARNGAAVGIDLGLKNLATLSDGSKIAAPRLYRASERQLALHQSRGQKVRARALSAKIANRRKHFLHVETNKIARDHAEIYVGDVNASQLKRTKMAKSIGDAGWTMFRNMLSYKAIALGGKCEVVSERWTTQTCSSCGSLPQSRPKGIAGLGIRHFECSDCGTLHDRDVNAALNILRVGLER
jgi:putative transposase